MRKLSESVWGDIRKKSLGQESRIEDDINSLSLKGLCSYLNENYTCRDDNCIFCQTMGDTLVLTVALYYSLGATGYLYYTGEEIAIYKSSLDTLRCRGKLTHSYATSFDMDSTTISPKDKSIPVNNKFFIEVLNFFIDIVSKSGFEQQIKKKLSESVWADIRKKSLGQEDRLENYINNMTIDEFSKYLKEIYVCNSEHRIKDYRPRVNLIVIPIMEKNTDCMSLGINFDVNGVIEYMTISNSIILYHMDLLEMTNLFVECGGKGYSLDEDNASIDRANGEKGGRLKKSDCIKIIDSFLEAIPDVLDDDCNGPLLTKKK